MLGQFSIRNEMKLTFKGVTEKVYFKSCPKKHSKNK